jgi:hypothetical protein
MLDIYANVRIIRAESEGETNKQGGSMTTRLKDIIEDMRDRGQDVTAETVQKKKEFYEQTFGVVFTETKEEIENLIEQ